MGRVNFRNSLQWGSGEHRRELSAEEYQLRTYVLRRLLLLIPNVFILATAIFFLMRVVPGDAAIALNLTGDGTILSWEDVEKTREELGLNDPIWIQYGRWMGNMLKGDLGYSPLRQLNVSEIILAKAEVTFLLAFLAVIWGVLFSIPLGIISALKRGSWIDQLIRTFSVGGLSVPNFWLGILILLMFILYQMIWEINFIIPVGQS